MDHYDSFQTICGWAGVELADRNYPGRSYAPIVGGEASDWDDTRYGEYGDLRMIRTPEYKYVKRYPNGPLDLFSLAEDPDETLNRAGWDEYRSVQSALDEQLEGWHSRHEESASSGRTVKFQRVHNRNEAWRDGRRERAGLQVYELWA